MALKKKLHGFPSDSAFAWKLYLQRADLYGKAILVPGNSDAFSIASQLKCFDSTLEVEELATLETDLLRNRGPSEQRRVERIRYFAKAALCKDFPNTLFLQSAETLAQRSPRNDYWKNLSVKLELDADISCTELTEKLAYLGYQSVEVVEKPFEFAKRGSIVDVFSPLYDLPLRVELFGDVVESINEFFPESQRRKQKLEKAWVPPAREYVYPQSNDGLRALKSKLRELLDQENWERENRNGVLERVMQGSHFPTSDYWASLLSEEDFSEDFQQELGAIVQPQLCKSSALLKQKRIEKDLSSAFIEGEWVPPPSHHGKDKEKVESSIEALLADSEALTLSQHPSADQMSEAESVSSQELFIEKLSALRAESQEHHVAKTSEELVRRHKEEKVRFALFSSSGSELERLRFLLGQYSLDAKNFESVADFLESDDVFACFIGGLQSGFLDTARNIRFLSDEELLGVKKKRVSSNARRSLSETQVLASLSGLKDNDAVVHKEHGVARYLGLKNMRISGVPGDFVELEFKDGKVFLPVTRLNLIQKHSGIGEKMVLDRLSTKSFQQKKAKAKRDLKSIAGELLNLYSKRQLQKGPLMKPDKESVEEFAASFPFTETDDQAKAIGETLRDMEGPAPMDRLICGDVGYGKTEVAMRAAFSAQKCGYQVAVLVPTTLLAAQHYSNFSRRMKDFGVKVELLSRFVPSQDVKRIKKELASGECQIIIGTHRLLTRDLSFKKLGLLVVDEEQRFGVTHKERIKSLKSNVHVLTMTATPIPRTMNMAMTGMRQLSVIATPPQSRLSVRTHVARFKEDLIAEAVHSEIKRGGQVFYVSNRVIGIEEKYAKLKELLGNVSMTYVHGQMDEKSLEERMMKFYEGKTQLLLTTSIIESGLDVPNANTLIVERSDLFGLAQLYQIRGRVGRSDRRAHAYFLIPKQGKLSKDAEERLNVLESYQELGSGFHIASHDLDIRGAGDLLGRSQSGQITTLGFETFSSLMNECLSELKGEELQDDLDPDISIPVDITIPEDYIPEVALKLLFYRRLSSARNEKEIEECELELVDRFGPMPASVENLMATSRMKCQLRRLRVRELKAGKNGYTLSFDASTPLDPAKLVEKIRKYPQHFHLHPDGRLSILQPRESDQSSLLRGVEGALAQLETML